MSAAIRRSWRFRTSRAGRVISVQVEPTAGFTIDVETGRSKNVSGVQVKARAVIVDKHGVGHERGRWHRATLLDEDIWADEAIELVARKIVP